MLAVETVQPVYKKRSIFRRLSRRDREESPPWSPVNDGFRSPRKLQRRPSMAPTGLPTPPVSPKQHIIATNIEPSKIRKSQMATHIQCIEIPQKHQQVRYHSKHEQSAEFPLRVLPTAMPITHFTGTPIIRPWDIFVPPSQIFSLYLGFLPKEMSDKWFIYSEGPDQTGKLKVHFHRSWTGMKMAELFIVIDVKGEGAGKIVGIKWNGGTETNRMNEEEAKYMIRTSCKWTLGVELEDGK